MKNAFKAMVLSATVLSAVSAFAAPAPKTYQVTGPVLEVTDSTITVEKGKEKWTIARDSSTQVNGDLKVGEKVTITYKMVAADVEVKGGKPTAKKSDKGDTKKTETTTTTTTTTESKK